MHGVHFFVPDNCLHGAEFPIHATWDKSIVSKIRLMVPSVLSEIEIYNSESLGDETYQTPLVPGYIGWLFNANLVDEPRTVIEVQLRIEFQDGSVASESRSSVIFRPLVAAENKLEKANKPSDVEHVLKIRNTGAGTPIIKVDLAQNSKLALAAPPGIKEFQLNLRKDLERRIPSLTKSHPKQAKLLSELAHIITTDFDFTDEQQLNFLRDYFEALGLEMEDDESFADDVVDAVTGAFLGNVKGSTFFQKALEDLQSLPGDSFIITNALDELTLPSGSSTLDLVIKITDKQYNRYDDVVLSRIEVTLDKATMIPVHRLLTVEVLE